MERFARTRLRWRRCRIGQRLCLFWEQESSGCRTQFCVSCQVQSPQHLSRGDCVFSLLKLERFELEIPTPLRRWNEDLRADCVSMLSFKTVFITHCDIPRSAQLTTNACASMGIAMLSGIGAWTGMSTGTGTDPGADSGTGDDIRVDSRTGAISGLWSLDGEGGHFWILDEEGS